MEPQVTNESDYNNVENGVGTRENGGSSADLSKAPSLESVTSTNHNGHPIELAMTTTTSSAATTPTKNTFHELDNGHDLSESNGPFSPEKETERFDDVDDDKAKDSQAHFTTAATITIPPEFSQTESSSLFASSGSLTNGSNSSTSPNTNTLAPISVTPSRKEELLRQAQADRLAWIRKVSLPYHNHSSLSSRRRRQRRTIQQDGGDVDDIDHHDDEETEERLDQIWAQDDRLKLLHSSHAVQHLPSVTRILTHLYGLDRLDENNEEEGGSVAKVAARIQSTLEPLGITKDDQAVATLTASNGVIPSGSSEANENTWNDLEDGDFLEAYHTFWTKLTTPECTSLVQSMRTFLRNLENNTLTQWSNNNTNSNNQDGVGLLVERVATSLRTYIESTLESIQAHPAWRQHQQQQQGDDSSSEASILLMRRSLESFLYGHVANLLEKIMWDAKSQEEEDTWMNRVWSLQFIQAKHLELECLCDDDDTPGATSLEYQILQRPIRILQSVDGHFSPFEKLQRILAVYRSVNAALSEALNRKQELHHDAPKKLPSADDVLPTLILTVLRAKPQRILWNLRMIEAFSRPEYLRGEAGYAYTNLYGAIQFLQDIDLTNVEQSSTSLSIPVEEFRQGLEACRMAAEERLQSTLSSEKSSKVKLTDDNHERPELSVRAVRQARLGGATVNVEWATRWQEDQERNLAVAKSSGTQGTFTESPADLSAAALSRSYSFLTTRPEEVRVADLPRLLSEYRALVHTTERLLVERTSEANAARKKKITQQKSTLLAKAEAVESGMLRKPSSSNKPREL